MADIALHHDWVEAGAVRRRPALRHLRAIFRLARLRQYAHTADHAFARNARQGHTDRWLSLYLRSHL